MADNRGPDTGLQTSIQDGVLTIQIGVETLRNSVVFANWAHPFNEEKDDYFRTFTITDPQEFARDVLRALENEREDGSSLLTDMLDKACSDAVDDGSEACDYECEPKRYGEQ